ncbi:hypothetical protein ACFYVL_01120 [Streptomyces sp. NPDC004111]|uniref:WD40 repeat domain-containing protein n=1 Tax=Streptomyces sp. NPDC004111 TaxID=3364690 RepID=UPI0036C53FB6
MTALSQAAAGEKLPSLAVTLAYVRACTGDAEEWERRWRETAAREAEHLLRTADGTTDAPYRGLARFEPDDEGLFFGRERDTAELVERVGRHRLTMLLGPSGSGKSSLLRAGLVPHLRRVADPGARPAAVRILTPGPHPLRTAAQALVPADGEGDTCVIVDQFEEVFTLCHDSDERDRFIALLLAARAAGSRLRVVLGVRADFYARCLNHPELAAVVAESSMAVGPMGAAGLRAAIVKPAQAHGLVVERALTDILVREVAQEPGSLPLLAHALLETWRRRRSRSLTLRAYEAAGGIHTALARTAEELYAGLTPVQASHARRILLRLITPGEGTPDTRNPESRAALHTTDPDITDAVLERLAGARLITMNDSTVDLAHEALITAWPRLQQWTAQDRERLVAHRRLTEAARAWVLLDRDPGALYRGTLLSVADELLNPARHPGVLTECEHSFLAASLAERDRERARAARATRVLRGLTVTLALLLVLALTAGVMAWRQSRTNDEQRIRATAQRLAAVADGLRFSDPQLAMRLSVAAWRVSETPETRSALLSALGQKETAAFQVPVTGDPEELALNKDGRTLMARNGGQLVVWDTTTRRQRKVAVGPEASASGLSGDGKRVAVQDISGFTQVWDLTALKPVGKPFRTAWGSLALDAHGSTLLATGFSPVGEDGNGLLELWDAGRRQLITRRPADPNARAVVHGRILAACPDKPGALLLWNTGTGGPHLPGRSISGATCRRGAPVLAGGTAALIRGSGVDRWDLKTGRPLPTLSQPAADGTGPESGEADSVTPLTEITSSDDGRFLAATSAAAIVLWRTDQPERPLWRYSLDSDHATQLRLDMTARVIRYLGRGGPTGTTVRTLDIAPAVASSWQRGAGENRGFLSADSRFLATASSDHHTVKLALTDLRNSTGPQAVATVPEIVPDPYSAATVLGTGLPVSLGADGSVLAYGTRSRPGKGFADRVHLWSSTTRTPVRTPLPTAPFQSLALSPDAHFLVTSTEGSTEVRDLRRSRTRAVPVSGMGGVAFRPDNELAVLVAAGGDAHLVPLRSDERPRRLPIGSYLTAPVFSPDSRFLAVGDVLGQVGLWDGAAAKRLHLLAGTRGGSVRGRAEAVTALGFTADGSLLAVAGADGTLQVWDTASGEQIGAGLVTPGDRITSVSFAPGGDVVYAAGARTPLQRYEIGTGSTAQAVCRRAQGGLPRADWAARLPEVPYRPTC